MPHTLSMSCNRACRLRSIEEYWRPLNACVWGHTSYGSLVLVLVLVLVPQLVLVLAPQLVP